VHLVELLAVVPAGLDVAVRSAVAEPRPEGIVVHRLDYRPVLAARGLRHLADVAEVVAVVVVEGEVVLTGIADLCRLTVALVELVLVDAPVLQREKAAEEVVRGVRKLYLRGGQLPTAANGTLLSHLSCHKCIIIGDCYWQ